MALNATCPNPTCGYSCSIGDDRSPAEVICPKCGRAMAVSLASSPGRSGAAMFAGSGFAANLERLAQTAQTRSLVLVGLGCLGVLALSVFLPWFSIGPFSVLGIRAAAGVSQLILTLAAAGFVIGVIAKNQQKFFDASLYVAAGWSALVSLWRLIDALRVASYGAAGIGLFLSLLAALGAAGTLGYIAVLKLQQK